MVRCSISGASVLVGANHNVGSLDDGIDFLADFELFAFDSKKKNKRGNSLELTLSELLETLYIVRVRNYSSPQKKKNRAKNKTLYLTGHPILLGSFLKLPVSPSSYGYLLVRFSQE